MTIFNEQYKIVLKKEMVNNDNIVELTSAKSDGGAMTVEDIFDLGVQYFMKILA